MTDPGVHDLRHGHLSQPTYNVENKTWIFAQTPGHQLLRPVGDRRITIGASASNASASFSTSRATKRHHRQSHRLAPNLEHNTAAPFLARDARLSDTATAIASTSDSLRGDLLAFGRAIDVENKGLVRIAALPGGAAGESLRLVQLQYERHGWSKDRSVWLEVPTLRHGEVGWSPGTSTAIQQVCCASQPDDRSTFVAVRTSRSIDIFHPLFHKNPVPPPQGSYPAPSFRPSRLEASRLASLTCGLDEPNFVDVSFNPWDRYQCAVLDQKGNWSIHDIQNRKGRKRDHSTVIAKQGRLDVSTQNSNVKAGILPGHYDGWGRVLWVNEVSTIAVCNRRLLQFVDFQTGSSVHFTPSSLRLASSSSWILDLRRDPQDSSRILVLTSTHVLVLKVPVLAHGDTGQEQKDANVLIAWRHSLNDDDTTLRISPFADGEETLVSLRSLRDGLVLLFRYRQHPDIETLFSYSDPSATYPIAHEDTSKLSDLYLEALHFGEDPHAIKSGPGGEYRDQGIRFYNLHLFSSKLEASQRLMFTSGNALQVESPSWTKRVTMPSSTHVVDSLSVHDESDDLGVEPEETQQPETGAARVLRTDSRMLDMAHACEKLEEQDDNAPKKDSTVVMTELTEEFASSLVPEDYRNDTLFHLDNRGSDFDVADIVETDEIFSSMTRANFAQDGEATLLLTKPVPRTPRLTPRFVQYEDNGPSISGTYGTIVSSWISELPAQCPGRIRLADERLARHIATTSSLASTTLRIQHLEAQTDLEEELEDTGSQVMTPSSSMESGSGMARRDSLPSYSQISGFSLPTPEPTPSLSSATTMSSGMSSLTSSAWTRLEQLTKMGSRVAAPSRFERQVLGRWTVGDEPKRPKSSAGRKRKADWEQEDFLDRELEKLFEKTEKRLKQQRRQTELHEAQSQSQTPRPMLSQPIPDLRSSPGPQRRMTIGGSSQLPSTQVERGAHGGRPKKMRRKTGVGF